MWLSQTQRKLHCFISCNENVLITKVIILPSRPKVIIKDIFWLPLRRALNRLICLKNKTYVLFTVNSFYSIAIVIITFFFKRSLLIILTSYPPPNSTSEKHDISVTPCVYHLQHSPLRPECVTQSFSYNEFSRAAALLVVTKRERCAQTRGERDSEKWKWCKEDEWVLNL